MGKRFFFPLFLTAITVLLLAALTDFGAPIALGILLILLIVALVMRRHRLLVGAALLISLMLTVSFQARLRVYDETITHATVTGRVSAIYTASGENALILEDAVIEKGGRRFDCQNVEVLLTDADAFRAGYVLRTEGTAYGNGTAANQPGERSAQLSALADRCSHVVRGCSRAEVISYQVRPDSVFDSLRRSIREKIDAVGDEDAVHDVLYAMITGDRGPVDAQTYAAFTETGTAHLLAVSGLHISVLLGAVLLLLRRLPIRPVFYLAPLAVFLAFYCLLTGLSPSVLRAALMMLLLLCASAFGTRYDPLNALSLAGLLILSVNPFRLFDCSFQLSFSAYFGIAAYHRAHRFSALSLTLSATLGSLPVTLFVFRRFAPLTLFANLLFVPIASMALFLLFFGLLISTLMPFASVVLMVPYRMMYLLLFLASSARSLSPPILTEPFSAWLLIPAFGALLFFSRFVHIRGAIKRAVAAVGCLLLLFALIGSAVIEQNTVTLCALSTGTRTPAVHVRCGADVMVHSAAEDSFSYRSYVANNTGCLDAVFVLTQTEADRAPSFWQKGDVKELYFLPGLTIPSDLPAPARILNVPVTVGRAVFTPVEGGLMVSYREHSVFIEATAPTHRRVDAAIGRAGSHTDLLISRREDDAAATAVYPTAYYGCVWITLGKAIDVHPFHEVRIYESY
ncbi:MAG: ComEC/Rec2 family competence protein [Clostridia bacterium]|nr:ComEC/Rec2 family competence protein [Clostridia bacterium]